jgi:hypothetical protein
MSDSSSINYENIDSMINALYDYEVHSSDLYKLEQIPKHEIQSWQYKHGDEFSWEHVFKNTEIEFIEKKNNIYVFKRKSYASHPSLLKIGIYENKMQTNNISNPLNINLAITFTLNELVAQKKNKFIQYMISSFDALVDKLKPYKVIWDKMANHNSPAGTICQVQIMEGWFKNINIVELLKKKELDENQLRALIFQALYCLAQIQESWPFFQHDNLTIQSFDTYLKKQTKEYKEYVLGTTEFKIQEPGFELKLCEFYTSSLPGFIDNPKRLKPDDASRDHKTFLKSIREYVSDSIQQFIDDIYVSKQTPKDILLTHVYFSEYRPKTTLENQHRVGKKNKNLNYKHNKQMESSLTETSSSKPQHLARNVYKVHDSSEQQIIRGTRSYNYPKLLKLSRSSSSINITDSSNHKSPSFRDYKTLGDHNEIWQKQQNDTYYERPKSPKNKLMNKYTTPDKNSDSSQDSDRSKSPDKPKNKHKSAKINYKQEYRKLKSLLDNKLNHSPPQQEPLSKPLEPPKSNKIAQLFGETNVPTDQQYLSSMMGVTGQHMNRPIDQLVPSNVNNVNRMQNVSEDTNQNINNISRMPGLSNLPNEQINPQTSSIMQQISQLPVLPDQSMIPNKFDNHNKSNPPILPPMPPSGPAVSDNQQMIDSQYSRVIGNQLPEKISDNFIAPQNNMSYAPQMNPYQHVPNMPQSIMPQMMPQSMSQSMPQMMPQMMSYPMMNPQMPQMQHTPYMSGGYNPYGNQHGFFFPA